MEKEKIIRSNIALYISMLLFLIPMILTFPFPNNLRSDMTMGIFSIPVKTSEGTNQIGIVSVILLVASLIMLIVALKSYRFIAVIGALIAFSLVPKFLIYVYQETAATGINAISIDANRTSCVFSREGEESDLHGSCQVYIKNHSNQDVTFHITFHENRGAHEDTRMESLMNEGGPNQLTLQGNEGGHYTFEKIIDTTNIENAIYSGTSNAVKVKIHLDEKERVL